MEPGGAGRGAGDVGTGEERQRERERETGREGQRGERECPHRFARYYGGGGVGYWRVGTLWFSWDPRVSVWSVHSVQGELATWLGQWSGGPSCPLSDQLSGIFLFLILFIIKIITKIIFYLKNLQN